MLTVVLFLIILTILVLVHEFGHFITARKCGMKVYEFGMGFPPRAFGVYRDPVTKKFVWVWGKGKNSLPETVGGEKRQEEFPATLYSVNWLPIGGFCKIKGESGDEAAEADSFAYHKAWKRLVVLVAGVTMNVLLAAVLLGVGFMIGLPTDVSESTKPNAVLIGTPRVLIQQVLKDSPAAGAGLETGDEILAIDGVTITSTAQFTAYIQARGESSFALEIRRDKADQSYDIASVIADGDTEPRLGVALVDAAIVRYPWYIAIPKGFAAAVIGLINIFIAFFLLIKSLVLGQGLAFDVSGPVGIASIVGESARLGINYVINVMAMISLSLAAINILPIPALDGGRALFVIIEKIFRRPVPMRYEQIAHTIGFLLLMILIVVVTARDIFGLIR